MTEEQEIAKLEEIAKKVIESNRGIFDRLSEI